MRSRSSYCYKLHPVLAAFYSQWSALSVPCLPLSVSSQYFMRLTPALMFYNDVINTKVPKANEPSTRQILGPLLPIFFWDSPFSVPDGVRWAKVELNEDEVVANLIAEWLRWMALTNDPLFAELLRKIFSSILTKEQCKQHFDLNTLSQPRWGRIMGLTREQLAHGAMTLTQRQRDCEKSNIITVMNDPSLNVFKDCYDE